MTRIQTLSTHESRFAGLSRACVGTLADQWYANPKPEVAGS